MKWVPDRTGRFTQRPHYDPNELDYECESVVEAFLRGRYGSIQYPLSTNDLTILLEQETSDLDLYADLTQEGDEVEGVTDFYLDRKPGVRIARQLREQTWRENRLRTTITHELGHVKFHNFLWSFDRPVMMPMFDQRSDMFSQRCKRETILGASTVDWMEWQAGYASGAFLMPSTVLGGTVAEVLQEAGLFSPVSIDIPAGEELIRWVQERFQVSYDAARVRLLQRRYLTDQAPSRALFA